MNSTTTSSDSVIVTVELFGMARVQAGVSSVSLAVDAQASIPALLGALSQECPELVGCALSQSDDGAVAVADGYALNRNGLAFLAPEVDVPQEWASGDSLLLLSNQAGG